MKNFALTEDMNVLRSGGENEPALEPFVMAQPVRTFAKIAAVETFPRDETLLALRCKVRGPHPSPPRAHSAIEWPYGR